VHVEQTENLGALDLALALTGGNADWSASADPRYEGFIAMFGGWTAAVALAAITRDAEDDRVPVILSVNYVSPIAAGTRLRICTRRVGGGRTISHWAADVYPSDGDNTLATAIVVLAARRPSDSHLQATMPDAPVPEALTEWHIPAAVGASLDIRPIEGFPAFGRMDTSSLEWVREASGRPVDRLQLALLADVGAPRPFFWSEGPRPSATLAMTVYFHATDEEVAAVGDDYVLIEATGSRGNASIADQSKRIWSRTGVLLATSHQLCSYR
jgi:acyl-CoA thioesterase